ncbi:MULTISPECIES: transglycosylase SLT domain-containing protein [Limnospira]|uniref:Lytic transglycosylase catalytic n=1 Tax=Limnospira indica PCC 8005 TaxID=376219 RepID=A0A9P1P278_9CYAN|nr:transglycosylase SLT domain-containing protein [Limnospira indica]CDM96940.1 Lytic transglycosylase catalytic [Limnospira indica PCC 8005]
MLKGKVTQVSLYVVAAVAALLVGIFFPMMQLPKIWSSRTGEMSEVSQPSEAVMSLAVLSPASRRQELEEIATTRTTSENRDRARFLLAADLLEAGQPEAALEKLDGLERSYRVLAGHILKMRALAYEQLGDTRLASQSWKALVDGHPEDPVVVMGLYALGETNREYWDRAIAEFPAHPQTVEIARTLLRENPDQFPLLLLIAQHGIHLPEYGTYLAKLTQNYQQQLTPEDWENIGFGYWEKMDYGQGAIAYSKAPKTPRNMYRHARGLWLSGKIPESRRAYQELIAAFPTQTDPGGEDAGLGRIRLARLVEPREALPLLNQVVDNFPNHAAEALLERANVLDKLRSTETASQSRQLLLSQYSDSEPAAQLRWTLAQQGATAGRLDLASEWARQLITKNPDSELAPQATFMLGRWARQQGNSQDATKAFEYLLARYPESYYAWRAAVFLGWPVGDFTTVRPLSPHVEHLEQLPIPPAGSEAVRELYRLGRGQDAWNLWQVEFSNYRQQPSVAQQYTDGLMRIAVGDNLDGLWMISSLSRRNDPEEHQEYLALKQKPGYWESLYPFPFLETIVSWSNKRQLNPVLVTALIRQESRFMPSIKSVVGATGLMQVMPETGAEVAQKIQLTNYSLEDVEDNVNLGTYYFDFTHREYNNNSLLAVASYNAGPGAVANWVRRFGFNDPDDFIDKIPYPETYGYVKSVFGNYWNYLRIYNPEISQKLAEHIRTFNDRFD